MAYARGTGSGRNAWLWRPGRLSGRRRAGAFVAAVGLHAVIFLLAFSGAAGDLVSASGAGGGPVGPVFAVTLVRVSRSSGVARAQAASELQPLFARLRVAGVGAPMVFTPGLR